MFSPQRSLNPDQSVDLSMVLEEAVLQLRKEVPQEVVVNMFQKMVRQPDVGRPLLD